MPQLCTPTQDETLFVEPGDFAGSYFTEPMSMAAFQAKRSGLEMQGFKTRAVDVSSIPCPVCGFEHGVTLYLSKPPKPGNIIPDEETIFELCVQCWHAREEIFLRATGEECEA